MFTTSYPSHLVNHRQCCTFCLYYQEPLTCSPPAYAKIPTLKLCLCLTQELVKISDPEHFTALWNALIDHLQYSIDPAWINKYIFGGVFRWHTPKEERGNVSNFHYLEGMRIVLNRAGLKRTQVIRARAVGTTNNGNNIDRNSTSMNATSEALERE